MARYMRTDLGTGHSRLSPPTVLASENIIYAPIQGRLHPVAQTTLRIRQRRPLSQLRPPRVVTPAAVFPGPQVTVNLAPSSRNPRRARSTSINPIVVAAVTLGPRSRVRLAASSRRARRASQFLVLPVVVAVVQTELFFASKPRLTRTRRGTLTNSQLLPPTVVFPSPGGGQPISGIRGRLTYGPQTRPTVNSQLYPPTVVFPAPGGGGPLPGIRGRLTYGPRLRPTVNSQLLPPTVVFPAPGGGDPLAGIRGRLAYSPTRRLWTRSRLAPPTITQAASTAIFFAASTTLVRVRPRRTSATLRPPRVVAAVEGVIYEPIRGRLHPVAETVFRIRQRRPLARLGAPRLSPHQGRSSPPVNPNLSVFGHAAPSRFCVPHGSFRPRALSSSARRRSLPRAHVVGVARAPPTSSRTSSAETTPSGSWRSISFGGRPPEARLCLAGQS